MDCTSVLPLPKEVAFKSGKSIGEINSGAEVYFGRYFLVNFLNFGNFLLPNMMA